MSSNANPYGLNLQLNNNPYAQFYANNPYGFTPQTYTMPRSRYRRRNNLWNNDSTEFENTNRTFDQEPEFTLPSPENLDRNTSNLNRPSQTIAFEIHNKSKKFMTKKDELIQILTSDLNTFQPVDLSKYEDIYNYLRNTMGTYIDTSVEFKNDRNDLKSKFDRVIAKAENGSKYNEDITPKDYQIMGLITDFVFAHNLQDLFIRSYVEDCAGAYKTGNGLSCVKGIVERFTMTLPAVILDKNGGVFDELKSYFGISTNSNTNTPWNEMSNEQKEIVRKSFGESVENWKKNYNANPSKYANRASRRQGAYNYVSQNYKTKTGKPISASLKKILENEFIPSNVNTFNAIYAFDGGSRKTLKKSKRSKKTLRRRKH